MGWQFKCIKGTRGWVVRSIRLRFKFLFVKETFPSFYHSMFSGTIGPQVDEI